MKPLVLFFGLLPPLLCQPATHHVKPGDNPQEILERASPGDRIVFLPGLHQHPMRRHQSILYVDRPVDIELSAGAVLKLADHQTTLEADPEITTDHGARKKIDDLEVGGRYDLSQGPLILTIRIDGDGSQGLPDTFSWGPGVLGNLPNQKVPITGDWQQLAHGIEIRFANRTGHNAGSLWFVSYDGRESYGIRVGHGKQEEYIDGVRIHGKGTIDLNSANNVQPSGFVKDISACVLVHGRVRNVEIEGITMTNTMRSVMLYGEHEGKFLAGGGTTPGESYDAENISILYTRTINPTGAAYLLGHPSHRGRLSKVRCNFNYMETQTTSLEPNFNLDQYEVIGNVIKSGGRAIHCWRKSTNGLIKDNVRIDDTTGLEVVMVNAPGGWEAPRDLVIRDNVNHLSGRTGFFANVSGGMDNSATGDWSTVDGGRRNLASGSGATVTGGTENVAAAEYSRVHGRGARSLRQGEDVLAAGNFAQPGDAQTSHFVARQLTVDDRYHPLRLGGDAPLQIAENSSVSYRILVAGRAEHGAASAAFQASGLAHRVEKELVLLGNTVTPMHRSAEDLDVRIVTSATADALEIEVRGLPSVSMRWVARVELAEVIF